MSGLLEPDGWDVNHGSWGAWILKPDFANSSVTRELRHAVDPSVELSVQAATTGSERSSLSEACRAEGPTSGTHSFRAFHFSDC